MPFWKKALIWIGIVIFCIVGIVLAIVCCNCRNRSHMYGTNYHNDHYGSSYHGSHTLEPMGGVGFGPSPMMGGGMMGGGMYNNGVGDEHYTPPAHMVMG